MSVDENKETVSPDPSPHEEDAREKALQDQAATAARYVTTGRHLNLNPLGPDGRLSAASAAMALKHARAQDLPSSPSVGIDKDGTAFSAANLANRNQRPVERWKPEIFSVASKAALLANDYNMAEASETGSKATALAHRGPARDGCSPEGAAAAALAVKNRNLIPRLDDGYTENGHKNALLAAVRSVKRNRTESIPDIARAPGNRTSEFRLSDPALEAARITHMGTAMPREMFTEHPPVEPELEDKRHQAALRASAMSFANQLYKVQHVDDAGHIVVDHDQLAAAKAHGQYTFQSDIQQQALQYLTLQDAAQRLAAERLQRIQDEQENKPFRDYWGYPAQKPKARLSVRGHRRRRATSESAYEIDSDDEKAARRVRSQMSQLNSQMATVDANRREQDRRNLLAAAEKNVQSRMHKLDEQIFNDTGKMSPAMLEEWDAKARERAKANSDARMKTFGMVDVGGGKYIDQAEIDRVARQRVQPTLDRVTDKAEKQRSRDEERRLDWEGKKRLQKIEREQEADVKAKKKKLKREEWKARWEESRASKAKRSEEKRLARAEKRKSKEVRADSAQPSMSDRPPTRNTVESGPRPDQEFPPRNVHVVAHQNASIGEGVVDAASTIETPPAPDTHKSKQSKTATRAPFTSMKGDRGIQRFFAKFKRKPKDEKSFAGGAALTNTITGPHEYDSSTISSLLESDMEEHDGDGEWPDNTLSGVTDGSEEFEEARDVFDEGLAAAPTFVTDGKKTSNPARDTRFHEEL